MLKVNNKGTRPTPMGRCSGVFIVNFEDISHLVLVSLLVTLSRQMRAGLYIIELVNNVAILFGIFFIQ